MLRCAVQAGAEGGDCLGGGHWVICLVVQSLRSVSWFLSRSALIAPDPDSLVITAPVQVRCASACRLVPRICLFVRALRRRRISARVDTLADGETGNAGKNRKASFCRNRFGEQQDRQHDNDESCEQQLAVGR